MPNKTNLFEHVHNSGGNRFEGTCVTYVYCLHVCTLQTADRHMQLQVWEKWQRVHGQDNPTFKDSCSVFKRQYATVQTLSLHFNWARTSTTSLHDTKVHTLPFSFSNLASFTKLGENFKFILSINKVSKTATHSTFVFVLVSSKTAYLYLNMCW
jgi:hypothetical protein